MLVSLELRPKASKAMVYQSPLIAVFMTLITSMVMFWLMDTDPFLAINAYFIEPVSTLDGVAELLVKATPLILIALGLSVGFQANIWNIGAEGQFTIGALTGGAMGLAFYNVDGIWVLPLMCLAGAIGGIGWASIPAFLRTRFNANEILVTLSFSILFKSIFFKKPFK